MHKKWKSGHKDKIAFSGQTKGVRRILRLISDHSGASLSGATVVTEPPDHRGAGFQDETRHRGGHLTITFCPKATRNSKHVFYFKKKVFFWAKSFEEYTGLRPKVIVWPPLLEPTSEELGGWRQAIRRGKTKSRFPAKPGEIQRFWGQMVIILANLKGELQGALSSSTCPTRQTLEPTSTNFWCWKLFNMGMTDFCDQPKIFNVSSANKKPNKPRV